jgi:hypothetical protein
MLDIDEFEGHICGAFHGIFVAACRAKPAVATKRNKLKFTAFFTAIHGTAIRRVTTINHLLDVFLYGISRMKSIYYFFVMVSENILKYAHENIMKQIGRKSKPPHE